MEDLFVFIDLSLSRENFKAHDLISDQNLELLAVLLTVDDLR